MPKIDFREADLASTLPDIVKKAKKLNATDQRVEILTILSKESKSLEEIIARLKTIAPRKWDFQIRLERATMWVLYIKKRLKPPVSV